jgi:hypothetical protein
LNQGFIQRGRGGGLEKGGIFPSSLGNIFANGENAKEIDFWA